MSVTGILIVIALMLALQIDRVSGSTGKNRISEDSEPASLKQHELDSLEISLSETKAHLEVLQAASRKKESEAEINIEIVRLEDQISRSVIAPPVSAGKVMFDPTSIEILKSKAAEIIGLRDEIRQCEEDLSRTSETTARANQKMLALESQVKEAEAQAAVARIKSKKLHLIRELSDC